MLVPVRMLLDITLTVNWINDSTAEKVNDYKV